MKLLPLLALMLSGCGLVETANRPAVIEQGIAEGKVRREFAQEITDREVEVGMNMVEVILSWGPPSDSNSRVSRCGRSEQWVYRRGQSSAQYVYFESGIVTSISSW